jgi:hypothetical protein
MRRNESHITESVMSMNVDGKGRPKIRWMECEEQHENKRSEHGDDE